MTKIYRGWKALQGQTGLGYDPSTDHVICSDEAWQSFLGGFKECNHLLYEGLRHKELYFNVFEKNHAAGASGYGSVTMPSDSHPYFDVEASMDYSEIPTDLEEDVTLTLGSCPSNNIRLGAEAGPLWFRASSGKRKQINEMDEMTFMAMQEIVSHFQSHSQSGQNSPSSNRSDHMLMCMSIMTEMGILPSHPCKMWHYLDSHPRLQRTFHQLSNVDRREIIASVVDPQPPLSD